MDIPSLQADLKALSAGDLGAVLATLRNSRDNLQQAIMDGLAANPPRTPPRTRRTSPW